MSCSLESATEKTEAMATIFVTTFENASVNYFTPNPLAEGWRGVEEHWEEFLKSVH